jgi:hypothetical protein
MFLCDARQIQDELKADLSYLSRNSAQGWLGAHALELAARFPQNHLFFNVQEPDNVEKNVVW